jgi:hypothetical protein
MRRPASITYGPLVSLIGAILFAACAGGSPVADAGSNPNPTIDAGTVDAGETDAGAVDAGGG